MTDKSGEIPCPSSYVAGDRAGGLQQVSRSTDELPDRGGHGMAGTNHTTLWSWISPMRVAKAAPAPRACCFVKHNLPAGVSSVQSCSQIKSVVFSRCGHLFGPECNYGGFMYGQAHGAFFSAGPSVLCPGPAVPFPKGNVRGPS